jgi:hypothetical protein
MPILISKKRGKVMRSLLNTIADVTAIRRLVADFRCWDHFCNSSRSSAMSVIKNAVDAPN